MKILVIANDLSGLYNFRRELLASLASEHEVTCAVPEDGSSAWLEKINCTYINTPLNQRGINPLEDGKLMLKYAGIMKDVKPDAVLTYTIKPNVYGGLVSRAFKVPYIANITGLGTAVEEKGWLQKVSITMYRTALKRASCVFFQNETNKDMMLQNKVVSTKHHMLPGSGVNLDYYQPLRYPGNKKIHFLFIGRLIKEKGIEQYFEAAEYITKKYPHTTFHIIGHVNEETPSSLNEMQKKGVIHYHGEQEDVRKFHLFSHCTIHPTYYPEGMSNVLLESAASARPAIATNRAGCREIVENGVNGYLVNEQDSSDLISKIEQFLQLSYEQKRDMGLAGRRKMEKEFDRSKVIAAYNSELNLLRPGSNTRGEGVPAVKKTF
jgi:glycosyltransferase involved in cell wall biosynthesis